MESIKIIKKLGHGVIGTTYLVHINNKPAVAKIEKILESDTYFDTSKTLWREIEFSKFASKYPDQFMQLKSWTILDGCKHTQTDPPKFIKGSQRKNLLEKNRSKYCSILIYTPVLDGTLNEFQQMLKKNPTNLNKKRYYSMICQMIYAINLMSSNGFIHRDIHDKNIMYKKTSKKTIKLGTITVPTYGLQWYIIDYGFIMHKDFDKTTILADKKYEDNALKTMYFDMAAFCFNTLDYSIWIQAEKHNLKTATFKEFIKKVKKSDEYKDIKKFVSNISEYGAKMNFIALLFSLYHPVKYYEFFGIDVVKYKKYITSYDDGTKALYAYIVKNINKPINIIQFIKKIMLI